MARLTLPVLDKLSRPECQACPRKGGVYVGPEVNVDAPLLFVGEAPGKEEAGTTRGESREVVDETTGEVVWKWGALGEKVGSPFVGPSGRVRDSLLGKVGLDRSQVSTANAVCCWLDGNPTPEADEVEACAGLLEATIRLARPRVIVALGGVATARLVGERAVGKWQGSIVRAPGRVMVGEKRVLGKVTEQKCGVCKGKGETGTKKTGKTKCETCHATGRVLAEERFKSGARVGELKPRREEAWVEQEEGRQVVLTYHPAALMDSGFAEAPLVVSALRRAKALAEGKGLIEVGGAIVDYPQDASAAAVLLENSPDCALDTEADPETGKLTLVGLSPSEDYGVTFLPTPELHEVLRKALAEPERTLVGQNIGYDVHQLETYRAEPWRLRKLRFSGWQFEREEWDRLKVKCKLWDTMDAAFYEQPDLSEVIKPKSLETIASRSRRYLYYNWKEAFRSGNRPSIFYYCGSDAAWTKAIHKEWRARLEATGRLRHFERHMMPTRRALVAMEQDGVRVDKGKLDELHAMQASLLEALQKAWDEETGGVNAGSQGKDGELRAYFHGKLNLPVQYKGRGKNKVQTLDEEACERLYELRPDVLALKILVHLRHARKILSTYLMPDLDTRGRVHYDYNLSGAVTGRWSGSGQQIPRKAKECPAGVETCVCGRSRELYIPDEGDVCLASGDFSQIEFRIWGPLTGDPAVKAIYAPGGHGDIHGWAALRLKGDLAWRQRLKPCTHGGFFHRGAKAIADDIQVSIEEAQAFLDTLRGEFRRTFQWQAGQYQSARKLGFITTRFGRRVPFKVIDGKLKETEVAAACAQSPAADTLNVVTHRAYEAGLKLRFGVHDELVISCREMNEREILKAVMEQEIEELAWACPADVGTGWNWAEAKH